MAHVFICYSRHDQNIVKDLGQDINDLGHVVWYDEELSGGQIWWDQILENIRRCDVFIFALAANALQSHACKLEYTYASVLGKTILPVLVADNVSMNLLPPVLSRLHHLDCRKQDKSTVIKLIRALNDLPESRPLPDPLPDAPEVPISYLGSLKEQVETSTALSFEDQVSLVFKLKQRLTDADSPHDILSLFQILRSRADLLATVATDIDSVVAGLAGATEQDASQKAAPQEPLPSPQESPAATPIVASDYAWFSRTVVLLVLIAVHGGLGGLTSFTHGIVDRGYGALVLLVGVVIAVFLRRKVKRAAFELDFFRKLFWGHSELVRWTLNVGFLLFLIVT